MAIIKAIKIVFVPYCAQIDISHADTAHHSIVRISRLYTLAKKKNCAPIEIMQKSEDNGDVFIASFKDKRKFLQFIALCNGANLSHDQTLAITALDGAEAQFARGILRGNHPSRNKANGSGALPC